MYQWPYIQHFSTPIIILGVIVVLTLCSSIDHYYVSCPMVLFQNSHQRRRRISKSIWNSMNSLRVSLLGKLCLKPLSRPSWAFRVTCYHPVTLSHLNGLVELPLACWPWRHCHSQIYILFELLGLTLHRQGHCQWHIQTNFRQDDDTMSAISQHNCQRDYVETKDWSSEEEAELAGEPEDELAGKVKVNKLGLLCAFMEDPWG